MTDRPGSHRLPGPAAETSAQVAETARWTPTRPTPTGLGSWPGTDPLQACREVFTELVGTGLPHLPELPARGPGADLIGRGCTLLVDLPVDLQPSGWRFVDRPGRDASRARSLLTSDLDALAETADGYTGPLKLQICGPWTLAGSVWLPRGERVVTDPGACRDLTESLGEGLVDHVRTVRRLVPGARLVVQVDEPSLTAVLEGRLPTASGFGRSRAVESAVVEETLRRLLATARDAGADLTALHSCSSAPPLRVMRAVGADALSVDVTTLTPARGESLAVSVEAGARLWAGLLPTDGPASPGRAVEGFVAAWRRIGLPTSALLQVDPTPACGLAGARPDVAKRRLHELVECADALGEAAG